MNVVELIERGEGKTVEFKRDVSSPQNILKTVTAFANTAGGVLLIALDTGPENHRILVILWMRKNGCVTWLPIAPRLVPNVEITTVEGKTLLLVEVFLSGTRPHWLKAEGLRC